MLVCGRQRFATTQTEFHSRQIGLGAMIFKKQLKQAVSERFYFAEFSDQRHINNYFADAAGCLKTQ